VCVVLISIFVAIAVNIAGFAVMFSVYPLVVHGGQATDALYVKLSISPVPIAEPGAEIETFVLNPTPQPNSIEPGSTRLVVLSSAKLVTALPEAFLLFRNTFTLSLRSLRVLMNFALHRQHSAIYNNELVIGRICAWLA
jgi:hypothetical protein